MDNCLLYHETFLQEVYLIKIGLFWIVTSEKTQDDEFFYVKIEQRN